LGIVFAQKITPLHFSHQTHPPNTTTHPHSPTIKMIIIISALILVCLISYFIDFFCNVKNYISHVQFPEHLSKAVILPDGNPVPSNVTYLPPSDPIAKNKADSDVYILFSGNPGSPLFYVDYMKRIDAEMKGRVHVYAIGHAFHSAAINIENYNQYNKLANEQGKIDSNGALPCTQIEFPKCDPQHIKKTPEAFHKSPDFKNISQVSKYILKPFPTIDNLEPGDDTQVVEFYGLYEQIAQKLSLFCKIRKLHPNSKIIIAGHSMGSYCWLELVRTMERAYVYKHWNEEGLIMWDQKQAEIQVKDVENEQFRIKVPLETAPDCIKDLENKVSQLRYGPKELDFWIQGGLLIGVPEPNQLTPNLDQQIDQQIDQDNNFDELLQKNALLLTHMSSQVSQNALLPIIQFHGLMPTILRIADTPNGHFMTPWFFRQNILHFLVKILTTLLPGPLKRVLFNFPAPLWNYPDVHIAITNFFCYYGIWNVITLATDEMVNIRSLDLNLVQRHADKFWLYMSDNDEWAPTYQREYLQAVNNEWRRQNEHINSNFKNGDEIKLNKLMNVVVDKEGAKHAFCFGNGNDILSRHSMQHVRTTAPGYGQ
jgi:hypothetical protein